jgi:hypothetical protein
MASVVRTTAFSIMAVTLAACGTGGGGGGERGTPSQIPPAAGQPPAPDQTAQRQTTPPNNTPRTDVAFTSFSAVQPNQNVMMNGASNLTLGFDSQRKLTALAISAPEGNVSFDQSAGHSISCSGGGICSASSPTASAIIGDALGSGWNYQTYGAWAVQSGPTSFVLGGVSAGNATPGNAVPTTGTGTFFGNASGYFIDAAGMRSTTSAAMIANVDFQNRAIGFTTVDTTLLNSTPGPGSRKQELDLSGSLSWAAGVNNFSGQVQTRDGNLNGSASGKFYGPTAQEIGGTYQLGGGGVSRMVGGFGGIKR